MDQLCIEEAFKYMKFGSLAKNSNPSDLFVATDLRQNLDGSLNRCLDRSPILGELILPDSQPVTDLCT